MNASIVARFVITLPSFPAQPVGGLTLSGLLGKSRGHRLPYNSSGLPSPLPRSLAFILSLVTISRAPFNSAFPLVVDFRRILSTRALALSATEEENEKTLTVHAEIRNPTQPGSRISKDCTWYWYDIPGTGMY